MVKKCPFCGTNKIKLNGHYNNSKQRFYCLIYNKSFSWQNKLVEQSNEKNWFKLWLTEGYSVRQLEQISSHSHPNSNYLKTLGRKIWTIHK